MYKQIGKYNTGDHIQMTKLHLPMEIWKVAFVFMSKTELGRVRRCCSKFNELAELCMREVVFRELKNEKNPLHHIRQAYPLGKVKDFFCYYMQHAILTQKLIDEALLKCNEEENVNTRSELLVLCDIIELKKNNIILLNNIDLLNSSFNKNRYCLAYWHYFSIMLMSENYNENIICQYFSSCEDALKKEKEKGDHCLVIRHIVQNAQGNVTWLLEVLLKKFLLQLSIKDPKRFLNLIWDGKSSILYNLNFHPVRKKLLMNLIGKLIAHKDGSTSVLAVSKAIIFSNCSNEALQHYLPLMVNPKASPHCIINTIEYVLKERKNLSELQQEMLMDLVVQVVTATEEFDPICRVFSKYEALCPLTKSRLIALANSLLMAHNM